MEGVSKATKAQCLGNRSSNKLEVRCDDNLNSTSHIHKSKALYYQAAIGNTPYVALLVYLISLPHYIANLAIGPILQSFNPAAALQKQNKKENNGVWTFKAADQGSAQTSI